MSMYEKLPHYVYIKNERYSIHTDYRLFIEFEKEMQGNRVKENIYKTLAIFYPAFYKIVNDKELLEIAIEKFIWFYFCGKDKEEMKQQKKKSKKKQQERIYDYDYDDQLIWGAFFDRGVNLHKYLHWWDFRALFLSLDDKCQFKKVMGYRAYDGKDKDMIELRELHKLPPTQFEINEQKRHEEIFNQLNSISQE